MNPERRYSVVVKWSEEDEAFVAYIPELDGISGVATERDAAVRLALEGAAMAVSTLREDGVSPPDPDVLRPYSGQLRLRLPRSLHRVLALEAERDGVSLNTHLVSLISEAHGRRRSLPVVEPEVSLHAKATRQQFTVLDGGRTV